MNLTVAAVMTGSASMVGLLLAGVAFVLIDRNRRLLVGTAVPAAVDELVRTRISRMDDAVVEAVLTVSRPGSSPDAELE